MGMFREGVACTVLKVVEMNPPCYLVRMEDDGREVNTERHRLSRKPQKRKVVSTSTSTATSPVGGKSEKPAGQVKGGPTIENGGIPGITPRRGSERKGADIDSRATKSATQDRGTAHSNDDEPRKAQLPSATKPAKRD